jgi:hypothetical protein
MVFNGFLVKIRGILDTTITVNHQALRLFALPDRHQECIIDPLSTHFESVHQLIHPDHGKRITVALDKCVLHELSFAKDTAVLETD